MTYRSLLLCACAASVAGCATLDDLPPPSPEFAAVQPQPREVMQVSTGGIYRPGVSDALLGRVRRFQPGDVLTVLLNETTQASRAANGKVSRASTNDVVPSGLATRLASGHASLTGLQFNSATVKSEGEGSADQSASLSGNITVSVVEVQSNGNLVVRGQKQMSLTQGSEIIQVSGIVRPEDVSPNNTVQSRRLADARFSYQGGGPLATAATPGWGTRSLLKLWPF